MLRPFYLLACVALLGCDDEATSAAFDAPLSNDARLSYARTTDARTTDARTTDARTSDASTKSPDASAKSPDAAVPHNPDAAVPHNPDAAVPHFDAPPPPPGVDAGPSSVRQVERPLGSTGAGNGFLEYLPPGYGDDTLRPLMVFWHGVGENGNGTTDLQHVAANGPPKLIKANQWPADRTFIVLSPQHSGGGCPGTGEIADFIAYALANYTVDTHRVYLTGLSCGAIGSWGYVGAHLNEVIAAAVLIAGDPGNPDNAGSVWGQHQCGLGALPIWSFHGDMDTTVLPEDDQNTMTKLIACPSPPRKDAQFTLYPGVGHDSWSRTYDLSAGNDIYAWLLQQTKP